MDTNIVKDLSLSGVIPIKEALYESSAYPVPFFILWTVPVLPPSEKPLISAAFPVPALTTFLSASRTFDAA